MTKLVLTAAGGVFAGAVALLLGCSKPAPQPDPAATASPAAPAMAPAMAPTTASNVTPSAIPDAMHGRWGLVPLDCTGDPAAAKGLMTVGAKGLEFYESRGRLAKVLMADAGGIRARYAFTGEGMDWTREIELALADDGKTLLRRDADGEMAGHPMRYTRCPAG